MLLEISDYGAGQVPSVLRLRLHQLEPSAVQHVVAADGLIELRSMLPPLNARALGGRGGGLGREMGITLVDLKNEVDSFHINFWNWRPIVEAVRRLQVLPDERAAALHEPFCHNGLSKEEARVVADALESRVLASVPEGTRLLLDGSKTLEPDDYVFHRVEQDKNYSATRPALEQFIDFCRACSGFEVL